MIVPGPLRSPLSSFGDVRPPAETPDGREREYRRFVRRGADGLQEVLADPNRDRALLVSPMGLRDILEETILCLSRIESERTVLLVYQGVENGKRWRKRLERLFGEERILADQDRWRSNSLTVELASIHALSRLSVQKFGRILERVDIIVLDKEHHVRPIIDRSEDSERDRFIRVLVEAGFLTKDFQLKPNPGKFLIGLTESLTTGAKSIYGGPQALVLSETLTSLLHRGFVARPEVRVLLPKGTPSLESVSASWASLSTAQRIDETAQNIEALAAELGRGGRLPRMVVYAGSREETVLLTRELEARPRYDGQVALMMSEESADEPRRERDLREFQLRLRPLLVHVKTMVEGVDEFQTEPVDAVVFAAPEFSNSLQYALQCIGAHLVSGKKPPVIVDQSGLFFSHEDLAGFDPTIYLRVDGVFRRGTSLARSSGKRARGSEILQGVDVLLVDLFGDGLGRGLGEFLNSVFSRGDRTRFAMAMGWSRELADSFWRGDYLPRSRAVLEEVGRWLGLAGGRAEELLDAWAADRLKVYEGRHPMPETLSPGERDVLRAFRFRLIRDWGGDLRAPPSLSERIFRPYLERGMIPTRIDVRRRFLAGLLKFLASPEGEEEVRTFLKESLGAGEEDFSGSETKKPIVTDMGRMRAAFVRALEELESRIESPGSRRSERVRRRDVARRAHEIYVEGLPEDLHPSCRSVEQYMTNGAGRNEGLIALTDAAGVEKERRTPVDADKVTEVVRKVLESRASLKGDSRSKLWRQADLVRKVRAALQDELGTGAELPAEGTLYSLVSGLSEDPEIGPLMQGAGVEKLTFQHLDPHLFLRAVERTVAELKGDAEEDVQVDSSDFYSEVHRHYVAQMKDGEVPPPFKTVRGAVQERLSGPEMRELLGGLTVVIGRFIRIDRERFFKCLKEALAALGPKIEAANRGEARPVTVSMAARLAGDLYNEGLPEDRRPHPGSFLTLLNRGSRSRDERCLALVSEVRLQEGLRVGLPVGPRAAVARGRLLSSFRRAIAEIPDAAAKGVSRAAVAVRACDIYCEGLSEKEKVSVFTFRHYYREDEEVVRLFDEAGLVREPHVMMEDEEYHAAFQMAVEDLAEDPSVTKLALARRAREIYATSQSEEVPLPSLRAFEIRVSGRHADPVVLAMIRESEMRII
jgi:hypothetical protein